MHFHKEMIIIFITATFLKDFKAGIVWIHRLCFGPHSDMHIFAKFFVRPAAAVAFVKSWVADMLQTQATPFFTSVMLGVLLFALLFIALQAVRLNRMRREAAGSEDQRKYYSMMDSLTGLPNRRGTKQNLAEWVEKCRSSGKGGGAFFLDIDNFRSVNNTFGHNTGDLVLRETAARLKEKMGENSFVGKIGGDEFTVLTQGTATGQKFSADAEKILEIFHEPYLVKGIAIQLSCTIGAVFFNELPQKKEAEFDDLINRGEYVLNEAKKSKKGSYKIYSRDLGNQIDRQIQLEEALKKSIQNEEILCYFQPQYNCEEKRIVGFEALARWKNPYFGMISPQHIIPMAEKSGFIMELGRFMVEKTFAFAKSIEGRGIILSFNTSPVELMQTDFAKFIISRFDYYGLAPGSVGIEITESSLIQSFEEVGKKLDALRSHGIQVYLDDFGTGFSSLNSLKNLPINAVKIDKSFIDEIVTNDVEKDIVAMIIHLASRLHLHVIAEGVESEEQINSITNCGCNTIQGYYISKPVPQNEVCSLLDVLDGKKATTQCCGAE